MKYSTQTSGKAFLLLHMMNRACVNHDAHAENAYDRMVERCNAKNVRPNESDYREAMEDALVELSLCEGDHS